MATASISIHKQRGAVLIIGLIMLAVMTLFVISMLKTSIVELKIGGASHVVALNFANGEVAINNFISANNLKFAPGFLSTTVVNTPPSVYGGSVTITPTEIQCGNIPGITGNAEGTGPVAVQFDIRATATGTLGGTTRTHQGVQALSTPGSCP